LSKCRLEHSVDAGAFNATLNVTTRQLVQVLAIDDNPDTLRLLKRYTSNTRYRLIATQDPGQALSLAEKFAPHIIILDIMMPQMDGWQLLEQLRQHPASADARIIVCSILGQSDFAFFMGADAMLTKPVTPQSFLAALDQQVGLMETGSR
jgi:CheY-like chemotaxis protein